MATRSKASLGDFLKSGTLGPLSLGMSMREAADYLGPPVYWSSSYSARTDVPGFWGYRNLELVFSVRSPRRLEYMQIARANELRSRSFLPCHSLAVTLDGMHGRMSPSEFLAAGLWPEKSTEVDVQFVAGELQLRISCRPVQLLFVVFGELTGLQEATAAFGRGDWSALAPFFENNGSLHSIGTFSKAGWKNRHWMAPILRTSGRAYLDAAQGLRGLANSPIWTLRSARADDLDRLADVERDAFETLREAGAVPGMDYEANPNEMRGWLEDGILLVAVGENDCAIGYVGAVSVDGSLHICELDVSRNWQRRGIGRALMRAVLDEGRARGLREATLTTDRYAPFNAAFYETLGFRILDGERISERLRGILAKEHAAGLDAQRRVAMKLVFDQAL